MAFIVPSEDSWFVRNDVLLTDVVKRVMRSAGITPAADLSSPSEHTSMAIGAIDAAAQRIWYAARWDWRCFWIPFELKAGIESMFTDLPVRYDNTGANPVCGYLDKPLQPIEYSKLVQLVPTFGMIPPDQMALVPEFADLYSDFMADDRNTGTPEFWGIHGSKLFFYPVLKEAADLEDLGVPGDNIPIMFNFYGTYTSIMGAIDDGYEALIQIPSHLMHILHFLAEGYFQGDLEYPGAAANEGRGEALLAKAVAAHRKLKRDSAAFEDTSDRRFW